MRVVSLIQTDGCRRHCVYFFIPVFLSYFRGFSFLVPLLLSLIISLSLPTSLLRLGSQDVWENCRSVSCMRVISLIHTDDVDVHYCSRYLGSCFTAKTTLHSPQGRRRNLDRWLAVSLNFMVRLLRYWASFIDSASGTSVPSRSVFLQVFIKRHMAISFHRKEQ
jgi:hypothetical protein